MKEVCKSTGTVSTKCLIIVYSYHHNNTLKIADEFSKVLNAQVIAPDHVILEKLEEYDLIGFGAGIDSGRHYKPMLDLADMLPEVNKKPAFIFSTSAIQGDAKVAKDHSLLRQKLQSKGYPIIGEFSCKGFNTNSFLKYFGGMNKGKPDIDDLKHAEEFALNLLYVLSHQDVEVKCK
ncbi:MAG TPA: flavodoxin family protein [Patescibacteria group bacterium]|nr:flavodoxin family protein [Patescibacteria group bacterium]